MSKPFNTRALVAALAEHLREIATQQDNIPFRTGQLRKSIISAVHSDTEATVGTNLIYARAVHDGRPPMVIKPARKKTAAWLNSTRSTGDSAMTSKPQPLVGLACLLTLAGCSTSRPLSPPDCHPKTPTQSTTCRPPPPIIFICHIECKLTADFEQEVAALVTINGSR
jgi:hypothetical protein